MEYGYIGAISTKFRDELNDAQISTQAIGMKIVSLRTQKQPRLPFFPYQKAERLPHSPQSSIPNEMPLKQTTDVNLMQKKR